MLEEAIAYGSQARANEMSHGRAETDDQGAAYRPTPPFAVNRRHLFAFSGDLSRALKAYAALRHDVLCRDDVSIELSAALRTLRSIGGTSSAYARLRLWEDAVPLFAPGSPKVPAWMTAYYRSSPGRASRADVYDYAEKVIDLVRRKSVPELKAVFRDVELDRLDTQMVIGLLRYTAALCREYPEWRTLRKRAHSVLIERNLNADSMLQGLF